MAFTPDQLAALALDRHLVVTANAGAGKTGVLTERFLRIVLDTDCDLNKVVAITFTNKAAAEMRYRIGNALTAVIANRQGEQPAARIARARTVLATISSARISTFHAFCGSLLRTFAGDIDLDADLRELAPRETFGRQRDAVMTTIRRHVQDQALRQRLFMTFDELGIQAVESTLLRLTGSGETLRAIQQWVAATGGSTSDILDRRRILCAELLRSRVITTFDTVVADLNAAVADGIAKQDTVRTAAVQLQQLLHTVRTGSSSEVIDTTRVMYQLMQTISTTKGAPLAKLYTNASAVRAIDPTMWTFIGSAVTATDNDRLELRQAEILEVLLGIATEASDRYAEAKRADNAVDFDDLMLNVRDMMTSQPQVARDVRAGIKHLMVDEFQDTNPTQYELVRALVPDLDDVTPTSPESPMLFIVGDAKQSIYGFRDADVRLFERAAHDIERANARRGWPSGRISLQTSFRMAPGCAAAINAVCTEIVIKEKEYDVAYDPIVCGRSVTRMNEVGSLSVIVTDRTTTDDDTTDAGEADLTANERECAHVAKVVARIADGTTPFIVEPRDMPARQAGPGDIAVLVRKGKDAVAMATALRQCGVPHQVLGGRDFFSRPEVADLRNLLLWSTDPADDLAFCAVMRSPLLRCTDNDLYHIACSGDGTMWERAEAAVTADGTSPTSIAAIDILRQLLLDVRVLSLPVFIRRALSITTWHGTIIDDPRRDQIIANVEKLIELVRDASRNGLANVRDVVQSILVPDNDNESEQQYVIDPNAVRIMTLHAAKGLEFPIVVMACMADKSGGSKGALQLTDQIGPTFTVSETQPSNDPPYGMIPRGRGLSHDANKIIEAEREQSEQRRLIYVGMTRAMDHLILSLPHTRTKNGIGTAQGLGKLLVPYFSGKRSFLDVDASGWVVQYDQQIQQDDAIFTTPMTIPVRAWIDDGVHHTFVASPSPDLDRVDLTRSLFDMVSIDMVSATELLPPTQLDEEPSATTITEDVVAEHGAAFGTIVHYLLQHGVTLLHAPDDTDRRSVLAAMLESRVMTPSVREAALVEALRVLDAPLIVDHAAALSNAAVETSLTASIDGVTIYGVMDVMMRHDDGTADVWDWKTSVVTTAQDVQHTALTYEDQMRVYAWLCLRTDPTLQRVRTRLLFTKVADRLDDWTVVQEWTRDNMDALTATLRMAIDRLRDRRAIRSGIIA